MEFEISNFIGMASAKTIKDKRAAQSITNFDVRERDGALVTRKGYQRLYGGLPAAYPFSLLSNISLKGIEEIYVQTTAIKSNVLVAVGTATLADESDAVGNTSILVVFIRPYWNGAAWIDEWQWLNETHLTKVTQNLPLVADTIMIAGNFPLTADTFKKHILYYPHNGIIAPILDSTYVDATKTRLTIPIDLIPSLLHTDPDTSVIIQKNFLQWADLQALSSIVGDDISFYKVLDGLRIAFGGAIEKIVIAINYQNSALYLTDTFPVDPYFAKKQAVSAFNEIILTPYNSYCKEDGDYNSEFTAEEYGSSSLMGAYKWFFMWVIVIDGFQKFCFHEHSLDTEATSDFIRLTFNIRFGSISKRISSVQLFASQNSIDATEREIPYYFMYEFPLTSASPDLLRYMWFRDDGSLEISAFDISSTEHKWDDRGAELNSLLGYTQTLEYVKSFDQGIVGDSILYAVNAYTDQLWNNKIFFSPVSGDAEMMYDVLVSSKYIDKEDFSGDNLIAAGLLHNQDLLLLKQNSRQIIEPSSGVTRNSLIGHGIGNRRSLVNAGRYLLWNSKKDIFVNLGGDDENISEESIRDMFRDTAQFNPDNVFTVRDSDSDSVLIYDGQAGNEYLFTPKKGFFKQTRYLTPSFYCNGVDGSIYFLNGNLIYKHSSVYTDRKANNDTNAIPLEWESMDINKALLGAEIPDKAIFDIRSLWVFGNIPVGTTLYFDIYLDGEALVYKTLECAGIGELKRYAERTGLNSNCHRFKLKLRGSVSVFVEIYSLGVELEARPIWV